MCSKTPSGITQLGSGVTPTTQGSLSPESFPFHQNESKGEIRRLGRALGWVREAVILHWPRSFAQTGPVLQEPQVTIQSSGAGTSVHGISELAVLLLSAHVLGTQPTVSLGRWVLGEENPTAVPTNPIYFSPKPENQKKSPNTSLLSSPLIEQNKAQILNPRVSSQNPVPCPPSPLSGENTQVSHLRENHLSYMR